MAGMGRRATIGLVLVAVTALAVAGGVWQARNRRPASNEPGPPRDVYAAVEFEPHAQTLARGVHMLGALTPGMAYVVETSAGLVLVDSGLDGDAASVLRQMDELGLSASQLHAVLLTHAHADHAFGAERLRQVTGAKVYAGAGDVAVIRAGQPTEAVFSTFDMRGYHTHGTHVDVELSGGESLDFGDTRIEVLASPGHSPGSVCYLLTRDDRRILFTGDVVSSLVAELGTYTAYLPPKYRGNARDYLATLRRLRDLPAPDLILTGHPLPTRAGNTPRPKVDDWHAVLERGIGDLQRLIRRFEVDGEDFLDGQPKLLVPGVWYLGDSGGQALYAVGDLRQQVLIDAPGDQGLVERVERELQGLGVAEPHVTAVLLTSTDERSLAGLAALADRFSCDVVAPPGAEDEVRRRVSPPRVVRAAEAFTRIADWRVEAIRLAGREAAACGWALTDARQTILATGPIPVPADAVSQAELREAIQAGQIDVAKFLDSLSTLRSWGPNLWLPAFPRTGQNANLYDNQWPSVLEANVVSLRQSAATP